MISNSFGLGEVTMIVFYVIFLSIPVFVVWLFFKTLRKISRHSEQIEQEMKKLREEIQSLREKLPGVSQK
jgi:energy-converting hydrogenase Eha subunit H